MAVDSTIQEVYRKLRLNHYFHFYILFCTGKMVNSLAITSCLASYALICYKRGVSDTSWNKLSNSFWYFPTFCAWSATVRGLFVIVVSLAGLPHVKKYRKSLIKELILLLFLLFLLLFFLLH